jgi:hypothetical protein
MLAVPTLTAVTSPVEDTIATARLSDLHVMIRPIKVSPLAPSATALACDVSTAVIELGISVAITVASGTGVTAIVAVPLFPSLVPVMIAVPDATAVTRPVDDTVAFAGLLEDQVTVRPWRTLLPASLISAESWRVPPSKRSAVGGVTFTLATGIGVTVITALAIRPSLAAAIVAVPEAIPVTRPEVEFTVATPVLSELHVTTRSVSRPPLASRRVAFACVVSEVSIELAASATLTEVTGAGVTVKVASPVFPSLVALM